MFVFKSSDEEGWYDKLKRFKRELIGYYLEKNNYIKTKTAEDLKINKRVLLFLMKNDDILKMYVEDYRKTDSIYDKKHLWVTKSLDP